MEGHSHHGLVISKDGNIVTGHATESKILILDKQGNLLEEIGTPLEENHGICLAEENGEEILWIADAASKVIKMTFDGTILKELVTGRLKCTTYGRFKVYHLRGFISRLFSPDCQPVFPVGLRFCCVADSYAL